jgi:tetratricopeptide (TPR) repeat protein
VFHVVSVLLAALVLSFPGMAASRGPDYEAALALWQAAADLQGAGNYQEARSKYQELLAKYPGEREVCASSLHELGLVVGRKMGDYDGAAEAFRKIIDEYPEQLDYVWRAKRLMTKDYYFPLGRYEEGLRMLVEILDESNRYEGLVVPWGWGPEDFDTLTEGLVREYLKDVEAAYIKDGKAGDLAHLGRSALGKTCSGPVLHLVSEAMLRNGNGLGAARSAEEERRYAELVSIYGSWLNNAPAEAVERKQRLLCDLAQVDLVWGETELAKQVCREVLGDKPRTKEGTAAAVLFAGILKAQGNFEAALSAYKAVPDTLPPDIILGPALGDMLTGYAERGEYRQGVEEIGTWVGDYCLNAHDVAYVSHRNFQRLEFVRAKMTERGEHPRARELSAASQGAPTTVSDRAAADMRIVYTYMAEGNCEAALRLCDALSSAYAGTPTAVEVLLATAGCKTYEGKYAEAREVLQAIMQAQPGSLKALEAQRFLDSLPE